LNNISVYECVVVSKGTDQVVAIIHCMGFNTMQATHEFTHYIFSEESPYGHFVEISLVKKLTGIKNLINPYFMVEMDMEEDSEEYDPEMPYKVVENLPDDSEMVMKFKCSCHEEIRVSSGGWLYIQCKNCENRIYRREIQDVGGINIYVPMKK